MKIDGKEYKNAIKQLIQNGNFNIAMTFNFNPTNNEEGCLNTNTLQTKIYRFNCRFFKKLYGSRWDKKNFGHRNIHIIEHALSNIHTHSAYQIDVAFSKISIRNVIKLNEVANKIFSKIWDKGTVYVSVIVSGGWADYMTKYFKYNRNEDNFFIF